MQYSSQLIHQLEQAVQQHQFQQIDDIVRPLNAADIADFLGYFTVDIQTILIEHLDQAAYILEFLPLRQRLQIAEQLPAIKLAEVLSAMHSDDRTDLYQVLSPQLQKQVDQKLSPEIQTQIQHLAQYPAESAGAIMSSDFVSLSADLTVNQAIEQLRQNAADRETFYLIYLTDLDLKLQGVVSLREMILAAPETLLRNIMTADLIVGNVYEDQESIAKKLSHYDFIALPIIDDTQGLVGIVTYDDAMDVVQAETTEDFLKSSAVSSSSLSLKHAPIFSLYKKRVFWLVILVFGSLLSGIGIAHFEDIIAANIVLVFFLPLLVGSGGNAGSQSATLMVRALATGDVQLKDWFYLIGRETLVSLCLGATMAFAVSILGYIRGDQIVALVLALSMMGIVLLGCLIGMSLPFILNRLKLDPASASAPLVTSICDATGVIVYLFIASIFLNQVAI